MELVRYSVIIPAYNAEKTINRCIDSIINNGRADVEIIIVNDGSKDHTDEICRKYEAGHANIRYCCKENEGVSIARNTGISMAQGEYLMFVDSDDYIPSDVFDNCDHMLEECLYDYIVFSAWTETNGIRKQKSRETFQSQNRIEVLGKVSALIQNKGINSPWAKVYKRTLINEHAVTFTPGVSIAEDRAFNIKYCLHINSICVSSVPAYIVTLDNQGSLSRTIQKNLHRQFELAEQDIEDAIKKSNLSDEEERIIRQGLGFCRYRSVYSETKRMFIQKKSRRERRQMMKEMCGQINRDKTVFPWNAKCLILAAPVKLRLYSVIDCVASRLAGGKKNGND